jgi:hypothetical protein
MVARLATSGNYPTTNTEPHIHHPKSYTPFTFRAPVQGYRSLVMYARLFRRADQTRAFTITDAGDAGWEVREEEDSQIVRSIRYTDWHRVERARMHFAKTAETLEMAGWVEAGSYSTNR